MKHNSRKAQSALSGCRADLTSASARNGRIEGEAPGRPREVKLEFPAREPDFDALRSVTREWLVPLLVEKFLRQQGIALRGRASGGPGKPPI